jgi:hypothetical protein
VLKDNETTISGFAQYGSIGSLRPIKYDKFLAFETTFKLLKTASENASLMDLDFGKDFLSFASIIYKKESLFFLCKDLEDQKLLKRFPIQPDNEWHDVAMLIQDKIVYFYIDENLITKYEFTTLGSVVRAFLGNNSFPAKMMPNETPAFMLKKALICTDEGCMDLSGNNIDV